MVGGLGGSEVLLLSGIIGGVAGLFFRNKSKSRWIGFGLGFVGAIFTTYIMILFIPQFYQAYPFSSILASWFFNFVFKKISK